MDKDSLPADKALNIMIVDDHSLIRTGMRSCFETQRNWHICAEASDGDNACRLAILHQPDVMVLDFTLPVKSGMEVTRELATSHPDLAVLIYTMHSDNRLVRAAMEAGARGWVMKTEDDSVLLQAVEAVAAGGIYVGERLPMLGAVRPSRSSKLPSCSPLTHREIEIVQMVAEGQNNRRIAETLSISMKTVDTHRTAAMRKLGLHTVAELVRYAIRQKIVGP